MSNGEVVAPQHYATFVDALARMTGVTEWSLTPGPGSNPGRGDFGPLPGGPAPTTGLA